MTSDDRWVTVTLSISLVEPLSFSVDTENWMLEVHAPCTLSSPGFIKVHTILREHELGLHST